MPRLYLPPERLTGERVELTDEPHRYLARVLRLGAGDGLVVFDGQGTEVEAVVERSSGRATTLRLGARRAAPLPPVRLTLVQGLPRGEKMELVVQKATELGVTRLLPVWTSRTVAQPGGGGQGDGRLRRWRTIAQEAARQCGRADLPELAAPQELGAALATLGAQEGGGDERRLVLWEEPGGAPLRRALRGTERAVVLLVGPEGGLAAEEVAAARAAGFEVVGLGPRILRSETAALVGLALVQAALGGLD